MDPSIDCNSGRASPGASPSLSWETLTSPRLAPPRLASPRRHTTSRWGLYCQRLLVLVCEGLCSRPVGANWNRMSSCDQERRGVQRREISQNGGPMDDCKSGFLVRCLWHSYLCKGVPMQRTHLILLRSCDAPPSPPPSRQPQNEGSNQGNFHWALGQTRQHVRAPWSPSLTYAPAWRMARALTTCGIRCEGTARPVTHFSCMTQYPPPPPPCPASPQGNGPPPPPGGRSPSDGPPPPPWGTALPLNTRICRYRNCSIKRKNSA